MRATIAALLLVAGGMSACGAGELEEVSGEVAAPEAVEEDFGPLARPPEPIALETPEANARRGRILFITNGCIICHQINGIGGSAAPHLDIAREDRKVDPLEFSGRMWTGAAAMATLQARELGYVIELDGQDIADLAAFAASPEERALLTEASITDEMRGWFLTNSVWTEGVWDDYPDSAEEYPFGRAAPTQENE